PLYRIQKRDGQGNWSVIATEGSDPGQVSSPSALAADAAGNLYVADYGNSDGSGRIQKREAQGHWSLIAVAGFDLGQYSSASPIRKRSHSRTAPRPSLMAQTIRRWPRRQSPARAPLWTGGRRLDRPVGSDQSDSSNASNRIAVPSG